MEKKFTPLLRRARELQSVVRVHQILRSGLNRNHKLAPCQYHERDFSNKRGPTIGEALFALIMLSEYLKSNLLNSCSLQNVSRSLALDYNDHDAMPPCDPHILLFDTEL